MNWPLWTEESCVWLRPAALAASLFWLAGCAGDSVETRRVDHWLAYAALPQEQREAVDAGQLRPGMSLEAVEIAWGKPLQTRESETAEGPVITWLYGGRWRYREIRRGNQALIERSRGRRDGDGLTQAEVFFLKNKVASWRVFERP